MRYSYEKYNHTDTIECKASGKQKKIKQSINYLHLLTRRMIKLELNIENISEGAKEERRGESREAGPK